jgi:hypothetical protein
VTHSEQKDRSTSGITESDDLTDIFDPATTSTKTEPIQIKTEPYHYTQQVVSPRKTRSQSKRQSNSKVPMVPIEAVNELNHSSSKNTDYRISGAHQEPMAIDNNNVNNRLSGTNNNISKATLTIAEKNKTETSRCTPSSGDKMMVDDGREFFGFTANEIIANQTIYVRLNNFLDIQNSNTLFKSESILMPPTTKARTTTRARPSKKRKYNTLNGGAPQDTKSKAVKKSNPKSTAAVLTSIADSDLYVAQCVGRNGPVTRGRQRREEISDRNELYFSKPQAPTRAKKMKK